MNDDELNIHIGRRIKERRKQLGISQAELADYLNITFQQVQKYEKGKNRIGAGTLFKIAVLFGVEYSYFVDDYKKVSDYSQDRDELYEHFNALMKIYKEIAFPEARTALINIAKEMLRLSENFAKNSYRLD